MPIGHPINYYKFKQTVVGKDIINYKLFYSTVKIT
jgi:hypothetical protein